MNIRSLSLALTTLAAFAFSQAAAQDSAPAKPSKPASTKGVKPSYRKGGTNQAYKTNGASASKARLRARNAQAIRNYNAIMNNYGTAVARGTYMPGYGVTGIQPTPVFGGSYLPGYGVMGIQPTPVFGGSYLPGYGVMGIQPTPVHGGTYMPGYGVSGVGAQQVHGGTYIPGYGVKK